MKTAILDRLNGPLCEALMRDDEEGRNTFQCPAEDTQAQLERMEQANLFLAPLDPERRWYRYHHLFAEFLRERLRRTTPNKIPALHLRAAAWFERQGLLTEAIHHTLAAGDFNRAARLICQIGETLISRSEVTILQQWLGT